MSVAMSLQATLGIDIPLLQGPMGGVSGPELVAAVSNAGGLGMLPIWADSLEAAEQQILETQALTDRRFAVNLRADLAQDAHISLAAGLGVDLFHLFWGDPSASARSIQATGGDFLVTVSDTRLAEAAVTAGAAALVAQGVEAGGHVLSESPLLDLLAAVQECAGGVPVIAAGGIGCATDSARMLEAGASGVLCGSRFVASEESKAHPEYKAAVVAATADDTVRSLCYDLGWSDAPHRTLRNSTHELWESAGCPAMGKRPGEADIVLRLDNGTELPRYFVLPPGRGMEGDVTGGAMYAGTSVGSIDRVESVAEIVAGFRDSLNDRNLR